VERAQGQERIVRLLRDALDGDASVIEELRATSQSELRDAGIALGGTLTFGRAAVLRVLKDWRTGHVTNEQARWWALLMFIGSFPEQWTPTNWSVHNSSQPLDVDYSDDEVVNEIVFRLKDIGDVVDGVITDPERDAMIGRLQQSA
jgi:hypothetical protein